MSPAQRRRKSGMPSRARKESDYIVWQDWKLNVTRNQPFWCQVLILEGTYHHTKDFGLKVSPDILSLTTSGTQSSVFTHKPSMEEYALKLAELAWSKKKIFELKKHYEKYAADLLKSTKDIDENLNPENWKRFIKSYRKMCAGLLITTILGRTIGDRLFEKLRDLGYKDAEIPRIIGAITYPREHTPLFESQLGLLKIGSRIQHRKTTPLDEKKLLEKWLQKYRHIPVSFCGNPWSLKDAKKQLEEMLKKDCSGEIKKILESHRKKIRKSTQTAERIGDKKANQLANAIAIGTYLNEFRKNVLSKASLAYFKAFAEIAGKGGLKTWRDCFYLTPEETINIIEGKKVKISKVKAERKIVAIYCINGRLGLFGRKKTAELAQIAKTSAAKKKKEEPGSEKIIRGFAANAGKAKGTAKVVLTIKDFHKFNSDDILVSTMTSVDFIPIMEKAAAFITDEGGITSHASIVARELNKPCIIGTGKATKIIKDGDIVEVDADKGTVKIIKKA